MDFSNHSIISENDNNDNCSISNISRKITILITTIFSLITTIRNLCNLTLSLQSILVTTLFIEWCKTQQNKTAFRGQDFEFIITSS